LSVEAAMAEISMVALFVTDLLLVVAAFKTSFGMGLLAIVCPFFAVTKGNDRLVTPHRRLLARVWWTAFFGVFVFAMVADALRK
jgi:hypothetical protein